MVRDTARRGAPSPSAGRAATTASAIIGATAVALTVVPVAPADSAPLRLLPEYNEDGHLSSAAAAGSISGFSAGGGLARGKALLNAAAFEAAAATKMQASGTHKVVAGDTVWALARTYNTTVAHIISINGLNSSALIRVGQVLKVNGTPAAPAPKAPAAKAPATKAPASKTPTATGTTHTVRAGQTVSGIAATYGTTTAAIASANGLANVHLIRVGQTLTIPGSGSTTKPAAPAPSAPKPAAPKPAAPTAPSASGTHKVVAGDTVWALSVRYGTTVPAIISANGLSTSAVIRVGQLLTIPGANGSTSTPNTGGTAGGSTSGSSAPNNACKDLVPSTFLHYTYSADVVAAANQNKCTLNATTVPSPAEMQALVRSTAISMGVDPVLAQAVAFQESGFNHRSVSPANAIGTMQVIPSSGEWAGQLLGRSINLLDPNDNVAAGVAILKSLQRTFPDNLEYAIGSYYQGASSVRQYGLASDTKNYVSSIMAHMTRFS